MQGLALLVKPPHLEPVHVLVALRGSVLHEVTFVEDQAVPAVMAQKGTIVLLARYDVVATASYDATRLDRGKY